MDIPNISYLAASILFIIGIKRLSHPKTAQNGNFLAALGMLIAILATVSTENLINLELIIIGIIIGSIVGATFAVKVEMTQMPQMVAIFNGFGGGASALVAAAEFLNPSKPLVNFDMGTIMFSVFVGALTLTGSFIAFGKLQGFISGKPITFPGQQFINATLALLLLFLSFKMISNNSIILPEQETDFTFFYYIIAISALMGILLNIPIGGADMPVVISLLNSYSGIAAAATGFVLENNGLIIAGSLVGASGIILTTIMCKGMNRSLTNVIFGAMGSDDSEASQANDRQVQVKSYSTEEAAMIFDAAEKIIVVPGYGLAVAQAQHAVREVAEFLQSK